MANYYAESLNADRLFQVYDTSLDRIKQYLLAEIDFVREQLTGREQVLELGAGYGRIVKELAAHSKSIVGIDISERNVQLGLQYLRDIPNADLIIGDVHQFSYNGVFDTLLCLQNGLSAMKMDVASLGPIFDRLSFGGKAFFSTYHEAFWEDRLKWFEEQANKGLLGQIDYSKTKNGVIACLDGFKATTHTPQQLSAIGEELGYPYQLIEVDQSSVFLIIHKG